MLSSSVEMFSTDVLPGLDEDYVCAICCNVLKEASQPSQGDSHLFCAGCLKNLAAIQSAPKCPLCNSSFSADDVTPILFYGRKIDNLPAICYAHGLGCTWTGSFKDLRTIHWPSQCQLHLEECELCTAHIPVPSHGEHDAVCPEAMVQCPNGCSEVMHRKEQQRHIANDCIRKMVPCSVKGCTEMVVRDMQQQHIEKNAGPHLWLILQENHALQERQRQMKDKIEDLQVRLKESEQSLQDRAKEQRQLMVETQSLRTQLMTQSNQTQSLRTQLTAQSNQTQSLRYQLTKQSNQLHSLRTQLFEQSEASLQKVKDQADTSVVELKNQCATLQKLVEGGGCKSCFVLDMTAFTFAELREKYPNGKFVSVSFRSHGLPFTLRLYPSGKANEEYVAVYCGVDFSLVNFTSIKFGYQALLQKKDGTLLQEYTDQDRTQVDLQTFGTSEFIPLILVDQLARLQLQVQILHAKPCVTEKLT